MKILEIGMISGAGEPLRFFCRVEAPDGVIDYVEGPAETLDQVRDGAIAAIGEIESRVEIRAGGGVVTDASPEYVVGAQPVDVVAPDPAPSPADPPPGPGPDPIPDTPPPAADPAPIGPLDAPGAQDVSTPAADPQAPQPGAPEGQP